MCAQNYRQFSFGIAHIIKLENKNNIVEHCIVVNKYNMIIISSMKQILYANGMRFIVGLHFLLQTRRRPELAE